MAGENANAGTEGQGGAAGAGAAGAAGAAAGAAAGTGAAGTAAAGAGAGSAATGAASTGFSYPEDRSKWIPPHRLNEVSGQKTAAETALAEANRKIAALAGVAGTDAGDEKTAKVKEAFLKMYPQLEPLLKLTAEQIAALTETPQHIGRVTDQEKREQARHGKQQINIVAAKVAEAIGTDKLNDEQQADLRDSFSAWFRGRAQKELQASGGEESATLARYEEGDETLLDEFVKRHTGNWVDPARRRATAAATSRTTQRVPNSSGRSQVSSIERPAKFNSLDERIEYAAKIAKERGHTFQGQ